MKKFISQPEVLLALSLLLGLVDFIYGTIYLTQVAPLYRSITPVTAFVVFFYCLAMYFASSGVLNSLKTLRLI